MLQYYGKKKSRLTVRVLVGRYLITAVCFNRPYYKQKLKLDETITITGKWDQHRQTIAVSELHFGPVVRQQEVEPVYSVKETYSKTDASFYCSSVKGIWRFYSRSVTGWFVRAI